MSMTDSSDTSLPRFQSLLVVRLSSMGDIIHTLPAAAALRHAFPHATLGWLVEERWAELLCALRYPRSGRRSLERPLVDRVHTVNLSAWRRALISVNTWQQVAAALSEVRGVKYDAAIDFQGAVRSALLARWSGAATVYGDAHPRENAASMFYTRQYESHGKHVVEQALDLASKVIGETGNRVGETLETEAPLPQQVAEKFDFGYRSAFSAAIKPSFSAGALAPEVTRPSFSANCQPQFPIDPDAEKKIAHLAAGIDKFAILNPGAGWGAKQWPAERYGAVAKELANDGISSLINFGPGEETLTRTVEQTSEGAARKIECSLAELIALTRRARLMIGGDTGPMHLAAALNVPVVAIFGPTDPARNGPFGTRSIVLRSATSLTDHSRHREPEQGLLSITTEEVSAAARKLLRESGKAPCA
jgi:heptosyltransferase-1